MTSNSPKEILEEECVAAAYEAVAKLEIAKGSSDALLVAASNRAIQAVATVLQGYVEVET